VKNVLATDLTPQMESKALALDERIALSTTKRSILSTNLRWKSYFS